MRRAGLRDGGALVRGPDHSRPVRDCRCRRCAADLMPLAGRQHETGVATRHACGGGHFWDRRTRAPRARRPRATDPDLERGPGPTVGDDTVERSQKENLVATLHHALADTTCVVITHQTGLTVA